MEILILKKCKVKKETKIELLTKVLDNSYGLCPAPMQAQEALDYLYAYLLGEDYILGDSFNVEQGNNALIQAILVKYSKEFRKDISNIYKHAKKKEQRGNL